MCDTISAPITPSEMKRRKVSALIVTMEQLVGALGGKFRNII
jgi:hypothetical protein